ncbi:MAG: DUF1538 domain-containing protein [Planctomycetota bacterium]|nr:DUF1538 domain-containing protein [Planctomycetota bacterium]
MDQEIRYGDLVHEISVQQFEISYNDITPKITLDTEGKEIPYQPPRIQLGGLDVFRLLRPYVTLRFLNQLKAVVPLAIYLVLFQVLILRQSVEGAGILTGGLLAVIVGLMMFVEGLKLGLMPLGETIGNRLPHKSPLWVVLMIAFLLGVGVTFAEPAIGALKAAGQLVEVEKAPYLFALLTDWSDVLVLMVGAGVGLAAIIGTLRFLYAWSLKPLIYLSLIPTIGLTVVAMMGEETGKVIGLAWDCGAVTTGPVTVPLVLALGIGVASASGKRSSSLSGFGIVTLASLFPICAVLCLLLYVSSTVPIEEIIANASAASAAPELFWYERSPWVEIVLGGRAIVPLVIFLVLVMKVILREPFRNPGLLIYGITLAVVGMCTFNLGLTYGLSYIGAQAGGLVPAAFAQLDSVSGSPLYGIVVGVGTALGFAWVLGFGATLAEPALNALGMTVENLTNGAFRKSFLTYAVSFGVACGLAIGVAKLIFDIPLAWLLLPLYALSVVLTFLSTEEFVNVAWDSAGVTTGPVTVPLVLAMGLGFGSAVDAVEGFGILAMASICPILSVMTVGLVVQSRQRRQEAKEEVEGANILEVSAI